jgi:hypothetical protein
VFCSLGYENDSWKPERCYEINTRFHTGTVGGGDLHSFLPEVIKGGHVRTLSHAKGRIFNNVCAKYTLDERPGVFIRDKPIFSSERMLHKDYNRKGSVGKKSQVVGLKGLDAKTN